jgi:CheY-like chemotaxis protein
MPSVFVVDDEDQIRQLIRETWEQAGYHVTEARDGKEALQQYPLAPADLVIMDILMPDQDGLETIHVATGISERENHRDHRRQ